MDYAPVLIITLNRYIHLKRCIESLAKCTNSDKTVLFIALDYPINKEQWEGYKKIKNYIYNINSFKEVNIIQREQNYGPTKNLYDAQNQIFKHFDRIIFSDDDNEFSPNFLDYMNKGLFLFEKDMRISAVCGFKSLIKIPDNYGRNYFCSYRFSAWGFGTWKNKNKSELEQIKIARNILNNPIKFIKLYKLDNTLACYFVYMFKNNIFYTDALQELCNIEKNTYSIYPTLSKVRNWGHDGSGVHGGYIKDSPYAKIEIDQNDTFNFSADDIFVNKQILKQLSNLRKINTKSKIKLLIDYIYLILVTLIKFIFNYIVKT